MFIDIEKIESTTFADLNESPWTEAAAAFDAGEPRVTQSSFDAAIDRTKLVAQLRKDGFRVLKDEPKSLDRWPR